MNQNPHTAPTGTTFRVRMFRGAMSDVPCDYWETVTVEENGPHWDPSWRDGSRRVSTASWIDPSRRTFGYWIGLSSPEGNGAIGWGSDWYVGVAEYVEGAA